MLRKAAKLMLVTAATIVVCQPKLLDYVYYYLWLWGGKH